MSIHITEKKTLQTPTVWLSQKAAEGTVWKRGLWLVVATLVVGGCASNQHTENPPYELQAYTPGGLFPMTSMGYRNEPTLMQSRAPEEPSVPTAVIGRWTFYREFWAENDGEAAVRPSDTSKVSGIAAYMKQNPSIRIGIDTFNAGNQDLRDRRVNAVREALIQDGVSTLRISTGSFGDPNLRSDSRVEVLVMASQD